MVRSLTTSAASLGVTPRAVKLWVASLLAAVLMALVMANDASASSGTPMADSDGYVPVYSGCWAGYEVGTYNWYYDGYAVYGTIYVNDCALRRLGAGPNDRQRVIAHEMGHARGLPHSSNPNSVMYPVFYATGT